MIITNTIPYFQNNYQPSLTFIRQYHEEYPDIFKEYFTGHCANTDERFLQAIERYEEHFTDIDKLSRILPPLIEEVATSYQKEYEFDFPININLIVGGFGSNAYTHKQIIPDITFCLERLPTTQDELRILIAHEFGHHTHMKLTDLSGIDWYQKDWFHPFTTLNQEGVATYLSKKIEPHHADYMYLAVNQEDEHWYQFALDHKKALIHAFYEDYQRLTPLEMFKEWFSINGGTRFGYARFGYVIALFFFEDLVFTNGEQEAIIYWREQDYFSHVEQWFLNQ
ncbi:hypothetical protein [Alkalihalobacillus pseudalcaliphilus]|uniref:hypothetical protein n=1 Tax=Alkalihalobacillus pseudalcaliphilus TaxID=79884 RepID=UPI00064D7FA7|nr:hypothetical protein [Alkalihalobacillus pseudalcaliphilus]KMK74652.1 hypothetical protein AB990_19340 [Alkalihalobacillus pseudalcaliphilus]